MAMKSIIINAKKLAGCDDTGEGLCERIETIIRERDEARGELGERAEALDHTSNLLLAHQAAELLDKNPRLDPHAAMLAAHRLGLVAECLVADVVSVPTRITSAPETWTDPLGSTWDAIADRPGITHDIFSTPVHEGWAHTWEGAHLTGELMITPTPHGRWRASVEVYTDDGDRTNSDYQAGVRTQNLAAITAWTMLDHLIEDHGEDPVLP